MTRTTSAIETKREAKLGSQEARYESLLGRLCGSRGLKAIVGAAILSTSLWLAGCGSGDGPESGSGGQTGSGATVKNPSPGSSEADPLQPRGEVDLIDYNQAEVATNQERVSFLQTQGKELALDTVGFVDSNAADLQSESITGDSYELVYETDAEFADKDYYFAKFNTTQYNGSRPLEATAVYDYPFGATEVAYTVGLRPDETVTVDRDTNDTNHSELGEAFISQPDSFEVVSLAMITSTGDNYAEMKSHQQNAVVEGDNMVASEREPGSIENTPIAEESEGRYLYDMVETAHVIQQNAKWVSENGRATDLTPEDQ